MQKYINKSKKYNNRINLQHNLTYTFCEEIYKEIIVCNHRFNPNINMSSQHIYHNSYYYRPNFICLLLNKKMEDVDNLIINGFDIFTKYLISVPKCYRYVSETDRISDVDSDFFDESDWYTGTLLCDDAVISILGAKYIKFLLSKCNQEKLLTLKNEVFDYVKKYDLISISSDQKSILEENNLL